MAKSARKKPVPPSASLVLAKRIAQAAHDTKAENVKVLDLRPLASFTSFFVLADGRSDRQVQAIADRIEAELKKDGIQPLSVEGYKQGHWVLLDYGAVVAHVFFTETREWYSLDRLWADAKTVRLGLR